MSTPSDIILVDVPPAEARPSLAGRVNAALTVLPGTPFLLAPVALGGGIGAYFALPVEPGSVASVLVGALVALAALGALRAPDGLRLVLLGVMLAGIGVLVALWRTQSVAAPVLGWHRYGPVEGRIVDVDRSSRDVLRLTLDRVVLPGLPPGQVPERVRISIHGPLDLDPVPGTRVMTTALLGPPPGPVEPGGFDFRRLAWFEQLGALGHTRTPVLALADPEPGPALALTRLRLSIAAGIRERLPGETGGFVAAILTGDRSGLTQETTEELRRSNLYHMVSISGLHMGLLTATVYGGLRALMALFPLLALWLPIRKLAAAGALLAASAYLGLSGGDPATERAYVMAAAMLVAVLVERRALSLRSVALAALLLLAWQPEVLLNAGFQMSFAATVALVVVFRAVADARRGRPMPRAGPLRRLVEAVALSALSSLVAGLATAPYAAAHFHRYAEYGLLANLLGVPVMGLLIMPAAVLAAALWPLGLEEVGLWLMDRGTAVLLALAAWVAGLDGAETLLSAPPGWMLPALTLGALWTLVWTGRWRAAGLLPVALALGGWMAAPRPALLIDREGGLVGLMGPEGRALSRDRGAGYVAERWLEADGDPALQPAAAARAGFEAVEGGVRFHHAGQVWLHLTGAPGAAALPGACRDDVVIVTNRPVDPATLPDPARCTILDPVALEASGAMALDRAGRARSAAQSAGERPWTAPRR